MTRNQGSDDLVSRLGEGFGEAVDSAKEFAQDHDLKGKARAAARVGRDYAKRGYGELEHAATNWRGYNPEVGKNSKKAVAGLGVVLAGCLLPLPGPNIIYIVGGAAYMTVKAVKAAKSVGKKNY